MSGPELPPLTVLEGAALLRSLRLRLADDEKAGALASAQSYGLLVQWPDGLWRGIGAQLGDDDHGDEAIAELVAEGKLSRAPEGVRPTPPPHIRIK